MDGPLLLLLLLPLLFLAERMLKMSLEDLREFLQEKIASSFFLSDDMVVEQLQASMAELRKLKMDLPPPAKPDELPKHPLGLERPVLLMPLKPPPQQAANGKTESPPSGEPTPAPVPAPAPSPVLTPASAPPPPLPSPKPVLVHSQAEPPQSTAPEPPQEAEPEQGGVEDDSGEWPPPYEPPEMDSEAIQLAPPELDLPELDPPPPIFDEDVQGPPPPPALAPPEPQHSAPLRSPPTLPVPSPSGDRRPSNISQYDNMTEGEEDRYLGRLLEMAASLPEPSAASDSTPLPRPPQLVTCLKPKPYPPTPPTRHHFSQASPQSPTQDLEREGGGHGVSLPQPPHSDRSSPVRSPPPLPHKPKIPSDLSPLAGKDREGKGPKRALMPPSAPKPSGQTATVPPVCSDPDIQRTHPTSSPQLPKSVTF
ncbi:hypothetical protein JZ751_020256 [Albula glossodonta]|uniref:Uncharacterized protein n=1 Tax=Albula glossodonta TaxID=121402 RepID=A0A8T2MZN8_9TELE|nr:hypothetical protein JZ751_020256 [Albula glossodonta]